MKNENSFTSIPLLCRADSSLIDYWLRQHPSAMFLTILPLLILSCGIYGGTLGMWHNAEMSLYVAIKFPLAILITLSITTLINGIIAMMTGSGISLRQSLQFLLIGFTIFGIILASLSPVLFFMNFNSPGPGEPGMAQAYRVFLTTNVCIIAFAGFLSFHILLRHVRSFSVTKQTGTLTFLNWLAINFLAGSQVTYLLRPFFGAPKLKTEFLRENMFDGNFFEALYNIIKHLN